MNANNHFKNYTVTFIWVWFALFALVPILLVIITSLLIPGDTELVRIQLTLENYQLFFQSAYLKIFLHSFEIAGFCTILCLVLGYPFAYILARSKTPYKAFLLLLIIIPFWTSSLIRTYAIIAIIKTKGILNTLLLDLHLISEPLHLLYTNTAVIIGLVYSLLPFMILPLYANIEKLDERLIDAARDLGANRITVFLKIIFPLTLPGIIAGSMLVLLPAMSMFYIPNLLGGAKNLLVGNLIENQFFAARNWPMGSAVSVFLTAIMGIMLLIYWRSTRVAKSNQELI